jgi:uncharacterized protein YtpQ (UPF0354 family)
MVVLRSTAPTQEAQASADFPFVGQLQFEFVFDHDGKASPASRQDLDALKLPIAQAQSLALQNIKRSYGEAKIERANGDILMLRSRSTDYASSFMLDRALWLELLKQAPQGFVAAVPRRGALLFAPADEYKAVEHLRKAVQDMYETGDGKQISTALYVFKGERWTVFQPSP